ncbi:bifunctional allantoicase/(S)-ureidoglycine aminohydrolase [Halomonas heilongjiangensis]|uniref:(S)-ureidoglycine aminohydrolase n=1 Tax=Halomonas heilongjiangensis TaxID=1387883 RepID=A0A2N7TUR0_9GAMM|nr:bifunctional allantoicase/(S)-ureidoglycine aminohydrolase [Halomonas heilongjiangensis]PMR71919.1 (S)-ureidoglycine aminohydrolase [Halomonas heilongjiangensis]PXX87512.1 (S)-ureidoglycine aminohydrolase [Halomonas heilongjiangensis]
MTTRNYYAPTGGHPPQTQLLSDRAVFTEAYAVIPKGVFGDIVTSNLPFWDATRLWVLARPLSGFAETFSQYIMEVSPGGGSDRPELDPAAEGVLFVVEGEMTLTLAGERYRMTPGGYAFIPPGSDWRVRNEADSAVRFHWVRKAYEAVDGVEVPEAFVVNENDIAPTPMPDTDERWATTRFVDPADVRHDMHVNIVTFQPGAVIPFDETHVMEHGLYVLEGKAVYHLNQDWVEVEAGDFMWLRAFCPQACYAGGPGPFRYLLYKDVNRHMKLGGVGPR